MEFSDIAEVVRLPRFPQRSLNSHEFADLSNQEIKNREVSACLTPTTILHCFASTPTAKV